MHDCDVMIAIGARFDDRVTGQARRLLAGLAARSTSTSTRPRSTRTSGWTCRIVGDVAQRAGGHDRQSGRPAQPSATRRALADWWRQIEAWRARDCLALSTVGATVIKPQYAVERALRT
jgi:acetolactate synthase-1/2/3 large subunit